MAQAFVVAGMYTDSHAQKAARLRASCERFGLAHDLRHVSAVHDSISRAGKRDPSLTKARLILEALSRHRRPVLYIDADCVIRSEPVLIAELLAGGAEFAIYNWAADRNTEAYVPAKVMMQGDTGASGTRYYRFATKTEHYDPSQLHCSGAVQLYADTPGARGLLEAWQRSIEAFPGSADDHCLDYTFNNRDAALAGLRVSWLPKEYARYAWWIHVEPVIDHPELAADATHFKPVAGEGGCKQFYFERAERLTNSPAFPPDALIDVQGKRLLHVAGKAVVREESIDREFWT